MPTLQERSLLAILVIVGLGFLEPAVVAGTHPGTRARPAHAETDETAARLDSLMVRLSDYGFSGTVLVERAGDILLAEGYGMADRQARIPNDLSTFYNVASITKTVTGAAILKLQALGHLSVFDSLSRILGALPLEKSGARLHHLATHTAGLVIAGTEVDHPDRTRFVRNMIGTPVESPPGSSYRYSNVGSSLLAAVVEISSGHDFASFARDQLFGPAGLSDVGFRWEPGWAARLAKGYHGSAAESALAEDEEYPWGTRGAGGLVITVPDLRRWYLGLRAGEILPSLEASIAFYPWPNEGYGWHVEDAGPERVSRIHKGGWSRGYASQVLHYPTDDILIVWASNDTSLRWRAQLNDGLTALARGEMVNLPPAPSTVDDSALERMAGMYRGDDGEEIVLYAGTGYLYARYPANPLVEEVRFLPVSPSRFVGPHPQQLGTIELLRKSRTQIEVRMSDWRQTFQRQE